MAIEWKRLQLHQSKSDEKETDVRDHIKACIKTDGKTNSKTGVATDIRKDVRAETKKADNRRKTGHSESDAVDGMDEKNVPSSDYLVACEEGELMEYQKQLLFDVLGPVFFGEKQAGSREELADLFLEKYGIDVRKDFCEGDEHYEEYREAQQAIAEGMSIYGGRISFGDCVLAELAGTIWEDLEKQDKYKFRRINTMLEE